MDAELKQYLDEFSERTDSQFRQVQEQFQHLREESTAAHEETRRVLRGEMAEMAGTLRGEMAEMAGTLRGEMAEKISNAVSTLRGEMVAEHVETRRHFDITVERWETRFDLLAESVQMVDQKLDRNVADIREEIATIKFTRPSRTRRAKR